MFCPECGSDGNHDNNFTAAVAVTCAAIGITMVSLVTNEEGLMFLAALGSVSLYWCCLPGERLFLGVRETPATSEVDLTAQPHHVQLTGGRTNHLEPVQHVPSVTEPTTRHLDSKS
jgi:hypothetical protein